ncbi:MAG: SHOCT domain-containing protein [Ignavibacteria bacterium]|nr:SHOCT domain-containing protein [Ignavibacteria bacterium]
MYFWGGTDRKYINIADWINKIDDARLNKNKKPDNDEIPLNTLKNRLAKGEISIEEYEILKKLIE